MPARARRLLRLSESLCYNDPASTRAQAARCLVSVQPLMGKEEAPAHYVILSTCRGWGGGAADSSSRLADNSDGGLCSSGRINARGRPDVLGVASGCSSHGHEPVLPTRNKVFLLLLSSWRENRTVL